MLVSIQSPVIRQGIIKFNDGLNVMVGDSRATNSIGKSSMLRVVDFVLGGDSFLRHSEDAIAHLGHHEYIAEFEFLGKIEKFSRATETPGFVKRISADGTFEVIPLDQYISILRHGYGLSECQATFRSIVGLFSRIWGKENSDISRPWHNVHSQKGTEVIELILKVFNKYDSIKAKLLKEKSLEQEKVNYRKATSTFLANMISKTTYSRNFERIQEIEAMLQDLKDNLAKYSISIKEIVNDNVMELNSKREDLLDQKMEVEMRLERLKKNLSESKYIKSKHFERLREFFDGIDEAKLAKVEEFHSGIARILKAELQFSASKLEERLKGLGGQISVIDNKIKDNISSVKNPEIIVENTYSKISEMNDLKRDNAVYDKFQQIRSDLEMLQLEVFDEKSKILGELSIRINTVLRTLVTEIYGEKRKSPIINMTPSGYTYQIYEDTGTGQAFSSLVIFDVALAKLSPAPVLIHDSFLFKNIQNKAIAGLLDQYVSLGKQVFVSLDEIKKYGKHAVEIIENHKVAQVSNDYTFFVEDWRTQSSTKL